MLLLNTYLFKNLSLRVATLNFLNSERTTLYRLELHKKQKIEINPSF